MLVNIQTLIDEAKCYEAVRQLRWPDGVRCPACSTAEITKCGFHTHQTHRQRYQCRACGREFDDLTDTLFEGHHQPLRTWVLCLYFMGLNLSTQQIAAEIEIKKPVTLSGDIELDEVYVIAGHKGHPEIVAELGRKGRRRRLKGKRGRGTLADEKPPIFGMLQRDGEVVIAMVPNVQRVTIEPLIQHTIQAGSRVYTDEYDIYRVNAS
jgi:transposase-like protein